MTKPETLTESTLNRFEMRKNIQQWNRGRIPNMWNTVIKHYKGDGRESTLLINVF